MNSTHTLSTQATPWPRNTRRLSCIVLLVVSIFVLTQRDGQAAWLAQQANTPPLVPTQIITPAAGQESPGFGNTIATVGDWLVVGAPNWDGDQGDDQGAIYLFRRNQGGAEQWGQVARLTAPAAMAGDHFGAAVAITADWLAVGAPQAAVDRQTAQGAVYLFARNQANPLQWLFQQKVSATAGTAGEGFGGALALTPNRLAIGATGKAYLFGPDTHTPPQWTQIKRLLPSATPPTNFGAAVAVQGDFVLVGAPNADTKRVGAAYLFQQNQGGANAWGEVKQFTPPDDPPYISFGSAVLLVGDQALIGAPYPRTLHSYGRQQGGANQWGEVQVLYPDLPITYPSREFGRSLAVSDDRLLVSAYAEVYVFAPDAAQPDHWQAVNKLVLNSDGEFSPGLAAAGQSAFVGANEFWRNGVYLFTLTQAAAPTIGFTTTTYTASEGAGTAVIEVTLDRPNPYPSVSIAYATADLGMGEATIGEDYTPVTGTLVIPQNALTGTFTIPLTNDALLEPPEKLSLSLRNVVNAVPGLLYATLQINDDDDAVCDFVAADEASLDRAIRCLYNAQSSHQTIQVTADISLTHPLPLLISPTVAEVLIEGNGHTIDAQGHGRVLTMYQIKAAIHNLTLRGGRLPQVEDWSAPNYGGGLYASTPNIGFGLEPSCALTLTGVVVTDNTAYAGGGLYYGCEQPLHITDSTFSNNQAVVGGAFSTSGGEEFFTELFVNRSTFSGNIAQQNGGAFDLSSGDGGVILQLVNSTVSSNRVISGTGGGLWITQAAYDGRSETYLINSTIANNTANQGSGVYNRYGILRMRNSLLADNQGARNCSLFTSDDGNGQLVSEKNNLDSDGTCLPEGVRQPSDLPNGNANLGPLADNGGATFTHALLPGSQALDAGDDAVCASEPVAGVDQRGVSRPQGVHCDIGAYEAATQPIAANLLFVSSHSSATAGSVPFRDEDILAYAFNTQQWQMIFDGSDVGITKDVDAFAFLADGSLLLSFNGPTTVPGLGAVDDSDLVHFLPTSLGRDTAGSFAWFLHGADVGLTTDSEDIDAISFTADGQLVVSTIGDFATSTVAGKDEDLIQLDKASGRWTIFFDGSTVGLANEDVNGLWLDPTNSERYLSVKDSFAFDGQTIDANDIFVCSPAPAGGCTYRLFWDSDLHDYGAENIDSFHLGPLPARFATGAQSGALEPVTPATMAEDNDADDVDVEDTDVTDSANSHIFLPLVER